MLLAIIAFFMLALTSVSALPVPQVGSTPGTLMGRTYSRKPASEGVMISRSPSPEALLEDEEVELLSRNERFHIRNQLNRRNVARHASSATLSRRIPELKVNTIQLVARRGL